MLQSPVDDGTGTYAVKPTIGRQTRYVVEQVPRSTGSIPFPSKAVLTLNAQRLEALAACGPRGRITLTVSSGDQRWSQSRSGPGRRVKLVTNGQVDSDGRLAPPGRHRHQG